MSPVILWVFCEHNWCYSIRSNKTNYADRTKNDILQQNRLALAK